LPLITDHPFTGKGGRCACGSNRVQYRGYHLTRTRRYRRFQCQQCGKWDHDKTPVQALGNGQMERRTQPTGHRRNRQ
jgi:hypothetical protein